VYNASQFERVKTTLALQALLLTYISYSVTIKCKSTSNPVKTTYVKILLKKATSVKVTSKTYLSRK